jgi:hypothetical protein
MVSVPDVDESVLGRVVVNLPVLVRGLDFLHEARHA